MTEGLLLDPRVPARRPDVGVAGRPRSPRRSRWWPRTSPGSAARPMPAAVMAMGAAADRCLQARRCRRRRPDGRLRPVDGRLRGLRALADGTRARRGPGPRQHEGGSGHPRGGRGATRPRRPSATRRATGSSSRARRRCWREGAPDELRAVVRDLIADQPAEAIAAAARGMAERPDSTPRPRRDRRAGARDHLRRRRADPARGHRPRWPHGSRARTLVTIPGVGHLQQPGGARRLRRPCSGPSWLRCRLLDASGLGRPPVD